MKKQLLDPIGTVCKLVGLSFSELNTKISIRDHVLKLDKPDDLQFLFRWINSDGKENISELYYVIVRIIKWYIIADHDSDDELIIENSKKIAECVAFRKMIGYMRDAFIKIQKTYKFGNVVLALQFYINILQDALNNKFDSSKLPKCILEKDEEYNNLLDYDKIKNLWDTDKITRICDLYDNCFKVEKNLEMPEKTRNAIIEGYLISINAILEVTDQEFQKLIQYSNEG